MTGIDDGPFTWHYVLGALELAGLWLLFLLAPLYLGAFQRRRAARSRRSTRRTETHQ